MKKGIFIKGFLLSVVVLGQVSLGFCADEKTESVKEAASDKVSMMNDPAMMEKWKEAATPGDAHKILEKFAGKFDYVVRWWMTPDGKPEENKGAQENKMILGNRFLVQDSKGESMGQPFEGMGLIGYDNVKKEYNAVWIDNMGTGLMKANGQYDEATKSITEEGNFSCPMTEEKQKSFRSVWKIIDDDNYSYEMYVMDEKGKEFRNMEIVYKRAK